MAEQHKLGLGGGQEQGKLQQCEEGEETDKLQWDGETQPQEMSSWGLMEKRLSLSYGLPVWAGSGGWRRWSFYLGWPIRSEGRDTSA